MDIASLIENVTFPSLFVVYLFFNMKTTKDREERLQTLINEAIKNNTEAINRLCVKIGGANNG